jgi:WD40 repeat protein
MSCRWAVATRGAQLSIWELVISDDTPIVAVLEGGGSVSSATTNDSGEVPVVDKQADAAGACEAYTVNAVDARGVDVTGDADVLNAADMVTTSLDSTVIMTDNKVGALDVVSSATCSCLRSVTRETDRIVTCLECSNGMIAAAYSPSMVVVVYQGDTLEQVAQLAQHNGYISSLCFTTTGEYLISGCYDGSLSVWSIASEQQVSTAVLKARISSIVFDDETSMVYVGSHDCKVRYWQWYAEKLSHPVGYFDQHRGAVWSLCLHRSYHPLADGAGSAVISGDIFGEILCWRRDGTISFSCHVADSVQVLVMCPSRNRLFAQCRDGYVHVFDAAAGVFLDKYQKFAVDFALGATATHDILAIGSGDQLLLSDIKTGATCLSVVVHNHISTLCFCPDALILM